jgi:hypothetical protein
MALAEPTTRSVTVLRVLLAAAIAESFVHYLDNTVRFADYAGPDPPAATAWLAPWMIAASWFAYTAAAIIGYRCFRRGRWTAAAIWLAVYSTSGLVSVAHYVQISISDLTPFQNTFVFLDIVLGAAILAFACWTAWSPGTTVPPDDRRQPVGATRRTTDR